MTRVMVVDDHPIVRAGVRALLDVEPDMEVVGEAADAEAAVALASSVHADVIVLDLDLPGTTGTGAIAAVHAADPAARIVILSMHATPRHVREAYEHGAQGYVPKETVDMDLIGAVRTVAAGLPHIHPALGARLAMQKDPLTARESQVATMLAHGFTNTEIAARLGISVRTAEAHRSHAMGKLGMSTRAELVAYAIRNGMLGPETIE